MLTQGKILEEVKTFIIHFSCFMNVYPKEAEDNTMLWCLNFGGTCLSLYYLAMAIIWPNKKEFVISCHCSARLKQCNPRMGLPIVTAMAW